MSSQESPLEHNNADRLEFLYLNMVGHTVCVHTVDGAVTEGLFVSRADPEAATPAIFLSKTRNRKSDLCPSLGEAELYEMLCIPLEEIVFVDAASIRVEAPAAGKVEPFRSTAFAEMNWAEIPPEDGANGNLEDEERAWVPGKWNQFAANEKFGVKSTYNEEQYTTILDKSKFTKEQMEHAERVAREIEKSSTRGVQHRIERGEEVEEDEGTIFSDVMRQQAAAPAGSQRASSADATSTSAVRSGVSVSGGGPPVPIEGSWTPVNEITPLSAASAMSHRFTLDNVVGTIAALLDQRRDGRRCQPDWPGEGDFYDMEDSDYKRQADELGRHHHPHHGGSNSVGVAAHQQHHQSVHGSGVFMTHHHHHHHHAAMSSSSQAAGLPPLAGASSGVASLPLQIPHQSPAPMNIHPLHHHQHHHHHQHLGSQYQSPLHYPGAVPALSASTSGSQRTSMSAGRSSSGGGMSSGGRSTLAQQPQQPVPAAGAAPPIPQMASSSMMMQHQTQTMLPAAPPLIPMNPGDLQQQQQRQQHRSTAPSGGGLQRGAGRGVHTKHGGDDSGGAGDTANGSSAFQPRRATPY